MFLDLFDTHPQHDQAPDLCLVTYFEGAQRRLTVFEETEGLRLMAEKSQSQSYAWAWITDEAIGDEGVLAEGLDELLLAVPPAYKTVLIQGYAKKVLRGTEAA